MELVSIILSTYNGEQYIKTQLESLINQTYKNIEIIITDDASLDTTLEILKTYANKYANIFLLQHSNNVGYIKNFERGIKKAKGNFIALSDQDDWWYPEKIEELMNAIKNYDLVYCDSFFVDKNLQPMNTRFSKIKNMISEKKTISLIIDNSVSGHAMLFKKSLFNSAYPFPETLPHDWWLAFVATTGNGIKYIDKALVKYRHHDSNLIASSSKKVKNIRKNRIEARRKRVLCFLRKYPKKNTLEYKILQEINTSYKSFSIKNNFKRVFVFYKYRKQLFYISKKSNFKKMLTILSLFFKIK